MGKQGSQLGRVAMVPMGLMMAATRWQWSRWVGGVSSGKHRSGHRDEPFWVGLGRNGVTLLVIGVGGAGSHGPLGLCKQKPRAQMLCSCCLSHLPFCDSVILFGGCLLFHCPPKQWLHLFAGRCNQVPWTGRLKQQKCSVRQSRRLEVQGQGVSWLGSF